MTPKRGRGQPTALTPEVQARICAALAVGSYRAPAAAFAGIAECTLYLWLARGEKEAGPYRDFLEAVKRAEAEAELRYLQRIDSASKAQWQASAWMLERKFKTRWGRGPIEVKDVSQEDDGDLDELTEEDLHVLLQSIRRKKAELARARLRATSKTH